MLAGEQRQLKIIGKVAVACLIALSACSEPEVILEGDRLDVRSPLGSNSSASMASGAQTPARLSAAQPIGSWAHRGGNTQHLAPHASLSSSLSQVWSVDIGEPESRRARITADPVSDGARIFTIDAAARLTAVNTRGTIAWSRDLTPSSEQSGLVSGGGLAVGEGMIFATSPYGILHAFRATDGAPVWEQRLNAVPSGPATIRDGLIYFVTRDNQAWALETDTGRIRWKIPGIAARAAFADGAAPAVNSRVAVFPFSSGEIITVLRQGGVRLWSGSVSGRRIGRVYAAIGDFASDPVISGNDIIAATQSGRIVGLDINTGTRNWTQRTGALGHLTVHGQSIWVVSDEGKLIRLNRANGDIIWSTDLPYFTVEKVKKRKGVHAHFGPILADGRLLIASSDGVLRSFDPSTGRQLSSLPMASGAAGEPIVVGQTLYIVTTDGHLRAFR